MSVITKASLKSNANAANKILNKTPTLKGLLERTANTNGRYISAPSLSANRYQQSTGKADDEKVKRLNTKEIGKPPKESIIGASYQDRFSATASESKINILPFTTLSHTRTVTRVEQSGSTGTSMGIYAYTDYNLFSCSYWVFIAWRFSSTCSRSGIAPNLYMIRSKA